MTWESFPDYRHFVRGNIPYPFNKTKITYLQYSLLLVWTSRWNNSRVAGDLSGFYDLMTSFQWYIKILDFIAKLSKTYVC